MSALAIGSWVWGEQRSVCRVIDIQRGAKSGQVRLLVAHPQGQSVIIPLERVKGFSDTPPVWAVPAPTTTPQTGHRVRVTNTPIEGVLIKIWDYVYWIAGERSTEPWATLQMDNGHRCKWKLGQLEATA